ncbi:hypothetical protein QLX08_006698 [Tetragonisca angustula]|uniref:Uncharacterized protein n=1 Tax=Tetragonisca angustula TaxID=166442 RepID=A0AAW0ZVH8_9HYME
MPCNTIKIFFGNGTSVTSVNVFTRDDERSPVSLPMLGHCISEGGVCTDKKSIAQLLTFAYVGRSGVRKLKENTRYVIHS